MSQVKVIVHGVNYEGAHFRGFESDTDESLVQVELHGEEQKVVDFILDNLSYGNDGWGDEDETDPDCDGKIHTITEMCSSLRTGETPIFDGCGAVLKIQIVGSKRALLNIINEYLQADEYADGWMNLGMVDVDKTNTNHNTINNLVHGVVR
jgi:hypothetical protein